MPKGAAIELAGSSARSIPLHETAPGRPLPWAALAAALLLAMRPVSAGAAEAIADMAPDEAGTPVASSVDELEPIVVTAGATRLALRSRRLDEARERELLPALGASAYTLDEQAVSGLPQGENTPLDKVLLQAPGVSYDSAISNPDFHVRNQYANVQYRIDGIQLPDGVSALGSVLETGLVGNLVLLDGTLPAQYGLRTSGVVDLTVKTRFDQGGSLDLYGGAWATASPSFEYGGGAGDSRYFLTGRYLTSAQGLESATPTADPIHDRTEQAKLFGYGSSLFGDSDRLSYMAGGFVGRFEIPTVEDQAPLGDFGSSVLASSALNENETDRYYFGLLALQGQHGGLDTQVSAFTRYASTDFVPDAYGDLVFNDVAASVERKSTLMGLEFDSAARFGTAHTLRSGLILSVEQTRVDDLATVLPLDADGLPIAAPVIRNDDRVKNGWTAGAYLQDEWRINSQLTLNGGARFDQMNQFVSAHQGSPRLALLYAPSETIHLHAGVARYFTPPMQAQATPTDLALFRDTSQQQAITRDDPVRPERSTYYDLGVEQRLSSGLTFGADVYYIQATDALDDGQFGQAVVLDQFNYAHGFSRGAELKFNYLEGGLRVYANLAHEATVAKQVSSNQFIIGDPVELAFLAGRYTPTSDAQTVTASAGIAYRWRDWIASLDGIYGSGLRAGFANLEHNPQYTQWNTALGRDFHPWADARKPLTVRASVINLLDRVYLLRSGTGVGEYAPQYGPRRGVFIELTQRF